MTSYCCTCAAPLSAGIPITPAIPVSPMTTPTKKKPTTTSPDEKTAIVLSPHRQLPCCDRFVCSRCLTKNARFATYCPYCQIATAPPPSSSSATTKTGKAAEAAASFSQPSKDLLPPGLKPPPPYRRFGARSAAAADTANDEAPPPYDPSSTSSTLLNAPSNEKQNTPILHYLDHDRDTIASLSLRYNVPADQLRQANRLTADHLLQARRVIQIPVSGQTAITESLSPQPIDDEAETRRKTAIRRFMVTCKVADYDLAVLYLEQTAWRSDSGGDGDQLQSQNLGQTLEYDLQAAVEAYEADEQWEKTHPVEAAAAKKKMADRQKKSSSSGLGFFSRRR
ncbi:hypothetical protein SBRCBS47491_009767 [Sporothrix bragantina]|uniref:LysM domain-containing protein n=1 Tax=Sporothrix bragantina TaxID=671064 RepID=A0ABP0CZ43_9PEZI